MSDSGNDNDSDSDYLASVADSTSLSSSSWHDDALTPPSPPCSSAHRRLRVRYSALRAAYRRQEAEQERSAARHEEAQAEARAQMEQHRAAQRAAQQLSAEVAQVREENGQLRRREQQWGAREQQLLADQRASQSQLAAERAECGRLQAEIEQQSEQLMAERRRLVATVSRHAREESAQQERLQSLSGTVHDLTAELGSREAEREELLGDMQALRDAVQVMLAHAQQQPQQPDGHLRSSTASAADQAIPGPAAALFLSPVHLASPVIDGTPSHCDSLPRRGRSPSDVQINAGSIRPGPVASPLGTQLRHATSASPPRVDTAHGGGDARPQLDHPLAPAPASTPASLRSAPTSVLSVSPFSADDFPPLPTSPPTLIAASRTAWSRHAHSKMQAAASRQHEAVSSQQDGEVSSRDTECATSGDNSPNPPHRLVPAATRVLSFTETDSAAVEAAAHPATASCDSLTNMSGTGEKLFCAFCQHAGPPASILAPYSFETPPAPHRSGNASTVDSPYTAFTSRPCSTCVLRASATLLTPASSTQRSFAVLDSEFRRVKRWTAQLQVHLSRQQEQQRRSDDLERATEHPLTPDEATVHSPRSPHASAPRRRATSVPHHTPSAELTSRTPDPREVVESERNTDTVHLLAPASPHQQLSSEALTAERRTPLTAQSLLVQLSLCESELSATSSSLHAANQHNAALQDKLSVMADSLEQLEARMDEQSQQQQLHARQTQDGRDSERRAAEQTCAELSRQIATLMRRTEEVQNDAASERRQHEQQSGDWERRVVELSGAMEALQTEVQKQSELNHRLEASLAKAELELESNSHTGTAALAVCAAEDESTANDQIGAAQSTVIPSSPPPLLHLVDQQLWAELTELQQIVQHLEQQ